MALTEEKKAEIRQQALAELDRLSDALAPFYLGKKCPLKSGATGEGRECDGPHCTLYLPLNDDPQKPNVITGGTCAMPLAVHELIGLNARVDALGQVAGNLLLQNTPRILGPK